MPSAITIDNSVKDSLQNGKQPVRSWIGQVGYRMLGRTGAIIGLVWILIVMFFAVFAPFIANSYPYAIKTSSGWSSPLLTHLYPSDVVLLIGAVAALVLLCVRKWRMGMRVAAVVWVVLVSIPMASWHVWARSWGGWTSEFGLTFSVIVATFILLMIGGGLVIISLKTKASWKQRLCIIVPMLLIAGALVAWPVSPSRIDTFGKYRSEVASGQIKKVVWAPIPFSPTDRLRDAGKDTRLLAPSFTHLMGTTEYGEDMASRMIHASRIAMAIGFIATGIALVIGIFIGGLMGYFSGIVDLLGMRLVEVFNAIPTLFLLIAIVAFYGRNLYLIMVIIGLTSWVGYALFVRAEFLKLRDQEFVMAARASGLPLYSILFKHMLPNGIAPVVVTASFGVASAILFEATLSFLGLGLVGEPSWGQMLNQARGVGGSFYWWIALYPGLAIFLTVFAYNLVGEALRDVIDPHTQSR